MEALDPYQPCKENGPSEEEEEEIILTQPTYGGMEGCGAADADVYDHAAGYRDDNKMINDDRSCRVGKDKATKD
jgi:hypothetical protein